MRFSRRNQEKAVLGAGVLVAALVAGSAACFADSAAKIDTASFNEPPAYPSSAQYTGEQGDVVLDVQVSASGRATNVRVKGSSGFQDLDTAAVQTAFNWHYVPAVINGDTATSWTTIRIHYEKPVNPIQAAAQTKPAH